MANVEKMSRRTFVSVCTVAAAPYFVPSSALGLAGTVAPSERVAIGLVGCGLHGTGWNLDQVFRSADAQVVAVCDVDDNRCQMAKAKVEGLGCEHAVAATGTESMRNRRNGGVHG